MCVPLQLRMAQVAAGCRQWTVSMLLIFLCFLGVNCIEGNQIVFSQQEYTFEEDFILGMDPLPNLVDVCYTYSLFGEVDLVDILIFTTDGTAIGDHYYEAKINHVPPCILMNLLSAGDEDFIPLLSNITQPVNHEQMCVTIMLLGDTIFEDDEQFTLTVVVNDLSLNNAPFSSSVTVTIQDNDGM